MKEQQAVFVYLPWIDFDQLLTLSEELIALLEGSSTGDLDGHEVDDENSMTTLFLYGPDAETLFAYVWPTLAKHPPAQGLVWRCVWGHLAVQPVAHQSRKTENETV